MHELTDDGWDYTLNLNLTSVFYSNRAAAQQFLKQQTGGAVLNLSSVLAFSPSAQFFGTHAYSAAKAAIVGLTKAAAAYYASTNIRFNVLAPGVVATPMSQRAQADPQIAQFISTKQPLDGGRMGQPSDLDAAAAYLLSEESRFVTGQVLAIDGGWSLSDGQVPTERPAQSARCGGCERRDQRHEAASDQYRPMAFGEEWRRPADKPRRGSGATAPLRRYRGAQRPQARQIGPSQGAAGGRC